MSTGVEYRVIKAATKNDAKLVLANMRDVKLKKVCAIATLIVSSRAARFPLINGLLKAVLDPGSEIGVPEKLRRQTSDDLKKSRVHALSGRTRRSCRGC